MQVFPRFIPRDLRKLAHWVDTLPMATVITPRLRRLTGPMSKRLRAAREDALLTQQQLADLIGMSLKSVNNYENPLYEGARKAVYVREWARVTGREFKHIWGARTPSDQGIARTRCRVQTPVAA